MQPVGVSRREVQVDARILGRPVPHSRVFVRGVVVAHKVQVKLRGCRPVDQSQEGEPFLMAVPSAAPRRHFAAGNIQGLGQGCCPVADVVVGVPKPKGSISCVRSSARIWVFSSTQKPTAWSGGLRYGPVNSRSLDEEGIAGQLERLREVGFGPEQREPALRSALGDPLLVRHLPHTPDARSLRPLVQHAVDRSGDLLIVVSAGHTRSCVVVQALRTEIEEALAPLANRRQRDAELPGNGSVRPAFGPSQTEAARRTSMWSETALPVVLALRQRARAGYVSGYVASQSPFEFRNCYREAMY